MASLRFYLEQICDGKAINYDQFLLKLPTHYHASRTTIFQTKLISAKPKKWEVKCTDETIFNELWALSATPESRVHASALGNSHNQSVSANLIMVYHQSLGENLCPSVVYVSGENTFQTFQSKKRLLLIENEENFIRHRAFCQTISQLSAKDITISNTDIALGGGNRATSKFLIQWYAHYDEVFCAFDYDLGGLKMFDTLQKGLKNAAYFIQPTDYKIIFDLFNKRPEHDDKLLKAINLAKQLGFSQLSKTFFNTRHFMEQESLLKE
jgi:hypothetical protein